MPCDTIQTNTVEVGTMHAGLLAQACKRAGFEHEVMYPGRVLVTVNGLRVAIENGKVWAVGKAANRAESIAAAIKRAYSGEVVRYAAARNGWRVRETGANSFQVIKG
mgnify:CR=1 FL=1